MIDFQIWHYLLFMFVGIFAGFLNVMAGGGSLITVPLMLFFGIPAPVANGTNRIALLTQNISSTMTFIKSGYKDIKLSITLSLFALPGAIYGAFLGVHFEGVWFNRTIALIMLIVMAMNLFKAKKNQNLSKENTRTQRKISQRTRLIIGHILMLGIGFYGGAIQMGVGFLFLFVLNKVMGIDLVRSNMHKVFIVMVYTLVVLFIYSSHISIIWTVGISLAIGNSIGAFFGTSASIKKGEKLVIWVLNMTLLVFIIKLLFL